MERVDNLKAMQKVVTESTYLLCECLEPEDILMKLKAEGAISNNEATKIRKKDTSGDQVECLLEILRKKPLASYVTFMEALKTARNDLYKEVKELEKKHNLLTGISQPADELANLTLSGNASDELTNADIRTITSKLLLKSIELRKLYLELELEDHEIENAAREARTDDFELQGQKVLQAWRAKIGKDATKGAILKAMKELPDLTAAMKKLKGKWDISSI